MLPVAPSPSFYDRADLSGPPGSLIDRVELDAPPGTRGWAVLYRSTGFDGKPVAVSGLVLAPASAEIPARVIAWAHGTTGIADACAPSRDGLLSLTAPGLVDLPQLGYVLTATDYEGLGTPGLHPYLVGPSEGTAVLDSIRAVAALLESPRDLPAAIVGISQGGHAALWAGEMQPSYATQLDLVGVVAASPPMDLRAVQDAALDELDPQVFAWLDTLLVVAAWHELLDAPIDGLLTDEGRALMARLVDDCPWALESPIASPFHVDPRSVPPWQALLEANSPGHGPSSAPILVLAATADEVIAPSTIEIGVDRLRSAGSSVDLRWVAGGHDATVTDPTAFMGIFGWLAERFR
jgi:pimeloyl-ACP methyl ester carboxylesterase